MMKHIGLRLYGDRAVHRVTDTGGACGGAGHAESAGCLRRERPESGITRGQRDAFLARTQGPGALIVHIMMQRSTEYGQLWTITIYCEYPNWWLIMNRHLIIAHYQL